MWSGEPYISEWHRKHPEDLWREEIIEFGYVEEPINRYTFSSDLEEGADLYNSMASICREDFCVFDETVLRGHIKLLLW